MKKIKGRYAPPPKCPDFLHRLVTTLFPRQKDDQYVIEVGLDKESIPPFRTEELYTAYKKLRNKSADGISNIASKLAIQTCPEVSVDLYNSCFEEKIFPTK